MPKHANAGCISSTNEAGAKKVFVAHEPERDFADVFQEPPKMVVPKLKRPAATDSIAPMNRVGDGGRFAEANENRADVGPMCQPRRQRKAKPSFLDHLVVVFGGDLPDLFASAVGAGEDGGRRGEAKIREAAPGTVDQRHIDGMDIGLLEVSVRIPPIGAVKSFGISEVGARAVEKLGDERRSGAVHTGDEIHAWYYTRSFWDRHRRRFVIAGRRIARQENSKVSMPRAVIAAAGPSYGVGDRRHAMRSGPANTAANQKRVVMNLSCNGPASWDVPSMKPTDVGRPESAARDV